MHARGSLIARMAGTLSIVFLVTGVALMVVVHVVVVLWALRWVFRERPSRVGENEEERGGGGGAGLSAEEVGELPCHDFKDSGAGKCAVCLEAFQAGYRCRVLTRCEHGFHAERVDSWLRKSCLSPICRAEVAGSRKEARAVAGVAVEVATDR